MNTVLNLFQRLMGIIDVCTHPPAPLFIYTHVSSLFPRCCPQVNLTPVYLKTRQTPLSDFDESFLCARLTLVVRSSQPYAAAMLVHISDSENRCASLGPQ